LTKRKRLILVETEMKSPKGHFLDCLIETTKLFEKKFELSWFINKKFYSNGAYIPKKVKIYKIINGNYFERKKNKFLYILNLILNLLINILQIFFFTLYFLYYRKFFTFFKVLVINYFIIPKYFYSFYWSYKKLNLTSNDHIFFQSARRNDLSLINFIIKLDINHPKFHIRVFLPPKKRFRGFFYFLNKLSKQLISGKVFVYLFGKNTFNYFLQNCSTKKNICISNLPWTFYNRKNKQKDYTIGFLGNARQSRGFEILPNIIESIENKSKKFNFLIHFSDIENELKSVKNKLYNLAKTNKRIKIIEEYSDYYRFRKILQKIDIMPIIHNSSELNKITSGTMYSCITHQIPIVIPKGTNFKKELLKHKSYEKANNIDEFTDKLIKISNNYKLYLNNAKKNSNILKLKLHNDPLIKNIC